MAEGRRGPIVKVWDWSMRWSNNLSAARFLVKVALILGAVVFALGVYLAATVGLVGAVAILLGVIAVAAGIFGLRGTPERKATKAPDKWVAKSERGSGFERRQWGDTHGVTMKPPPADAVGDALSPSVPSQPLSESERAVPRQEELLTQILEAIRALGGSTQEQIQEKTHLSPEAIESGVLELAAQGKVSVLGDRVTRREIVYDETGRQAGEEIVHESGRRDAIVTPETGAANKPTAGNWQANLSLLKIPGPDNLAALPLVQFTTANRAEHHEDTQQRPKALRFLFPMQATVRDVDLPAELPCGTGKLIIKRFTKKGFAVEEQNTAGVEVRAEVYYDEAPLGGGAP